MPPRTRTPEPLGPRLYIDQPLEPECEITLPEDAAAHARAFRLDVGSPVILFNGYGGEYPARIAQVEKKRIVTTVGAHHAVEREAPVPVHLLQAVGKADRMDTAVEKAVELGVAAIHPVLTERTVVRLDDPERAEKRRRHWEKVAISAAEQCGRNRLPVIDPPKRLPDALKRLPTWCSIRFTLAPDGAIRLSELADAFEDRFANGDPVALLIGPEGGLSDREEHLAGQHGFEKVAAGQRVLRTETAAFVALVGIGVASGEL